MTRDARLLGALPETGFIRLAQLIGQAPITPEQAEKNRHAGKRGRRPRPGSVAIIPWSPATFWRKAKSGGFPAPVKLSEGVTAWRVEDVRAWLDAQGVA